MVTAIGTGGGSPRDVGAAARPAGPPAVAGADRSTGREPTTQPTDLTDLAAGTVTTEGAGAAPGAVALDPRAGDSPTAPMPRSRPRPVANPAYPVPSPVGASAGGLVRQPRLPSVLAPGWLVAGVRRAVRRRP
ncbi:GGDEF-domain containing protein, partial [Frankia sp. AgB1.8]|nr:GGDEF-domain containing protein [Frankia sp. AgB1.8]